MEWNDVGRNDDLAVVDRDCADGPAAGSVGTGIAIGHHGEILQGAFFGEDGRLRRGLVTLPLAPARSHVRASFAPRSAGRVTPATKQKALEAARLAMARFGLSEAGVSLEVDSDIPEGFGLGSSTADVVAAIRAVAALVDRPLSPETLFAWAVDSELASDGTMFSEEAVLVAHREGRVIERFGGRLPEMSLVSVNTAPDRPVSTLDSRPARYTHVEAETFRRLRAMLRRAVRDRDPWLAGRVATASAAINQRHLPQAGFERLHSLALAYGAFGIQVAHSGRVLGILMPADLRADSPGVSDLVAAISRLGHEATFLAAHDLG